MRPIRPIQTLGAILLSAAMPAARAAAEAPWLAVDAGVAHATIVIPDDDEAVPLAFQWTTYKTRTEPPLFAAEFLQDYLARVTGAKLPIVKAKDAPGTGVILVGFGRLAAQHGIRVADLKPEGFRVQTFPGGVALVGEIAEIPEMAAGRKPGEGPVRLDRGTLFAVFEFLERAAGVRWYFGEELWHVVPASRDLPVPALDIARAPVYQMRTGALSDMKNTWLPALRWGGSSRLFVNHTLSDWEQSLGQTHPGLFGIATDGSRYNEAPSSLCLSNPDVVEQLIAGVKRWDEKRDNRRFFAICPPNEQYVYLANTDLWERRGICHCPRCLEQWKPHEPPFPDGGMTDLWMDFVLRVAAEVNKHWPGRRVAALAYAGYERAPVHLDRLPDNVDICLAIMKGAQMQHEPRVREWEQRNVDAWSRLVGENRDRLTVWQYFCYPNWFVTAPMLAPHALARWMRDNAGKVSGAFNNGFNPEKVTDGKSDFNLLMVWLWHQLLWDPQADVDALLDRFYRDLFGPAYAPMKALFDLEIDRWENTHWSEIPGRSFISDRLIHQETYPREVVAALQRHLDEARRLAPPGSPFLRRVDWYARAHETFFRQSRLFHAGWNAVRTVPIARLKTDDAAGWASIEPRPLNTLRYGDQPETRGEVRFAHDGANLLVRADLLEATPGQLVRRATRDAPEAIDRDDSLTLCFDFDDRPYYHFVRVNPNGVASTGIQAIPATHRGLDFPNLGAPWTVEGLDCRAAILDDRWQAEIRIPFRALASWGFDKTPSARGLLLQVVRDKRTAPAETTSLCPTFDMKWSFPMNRFAVGDVLTSNP